MQDFFCKYMPCFARFVFLFLFVGSNFLGCASTLYSTFLNRERAKSDLVAKELQVGLHKWTYLESGDKKANTIVFVHGFGGDKDNFTRLAPYFFQSHHILLVDLPGFGENSRIPTENYNLQNQSVRLDEFLKLQGISRYSLVGNSMGGALSIQHTVQFPKKVEALVLLDSAGVETPKPSFVRAEIAKGNNPLLVNDVEDFDRLMSINFFKPPYIPGFLKTYFAERAVKNRPFNKKIFQDYRQGGANLEAILSKVKPPTLVIWGDQDKVIDVSAVGVFTKKIPNAKSYILKDCGHLPQLERPEETAESILGFFKGSELLR